MIRPSIAPSWIIVCVVAVDTPIDLAVGATKQQLLDAMKGHILAQAELIGTYKR